LCELEGFEQQSSEEVLAEVRELAGAVQPDNTFIGTRMVTAPTTVKGFLRIADIPMYAVDPLVRRAQPLQQTREADACYVWLTPQDAKRLKVEEGEHVSVRRNGSQVTLPVKLDESIETGQVWIPAGLAATAVLGGLSASVELEKA
jgi:NADH-quinone oxidoreductase subunit G